MKDFLRPSGAKVGLFIVIAIVSFWTIIVFSGSPLPPPPFLYVIVPFGMLARIINIPAIFTNPLDLIYFYIISCFIFWVYHKLKHKG